MCKQDAYLFAGVHAPAVFVLYYSHDEGDLY